MLISKFDLYKSEWLELVFDDRNKAYGAYELRQHNSRTMATAMAIAFLGIFAAAVVVGIIVKPVVVADPLVVMHPVVLHPYVIPPETVVPPRPITHVRPPVAPPASAAAHVYVPLVVSPVPTTVEPPKVTAISGPVGPAVTVDAGTDPGLAGSPGGGGTSAAAPSDATVYTGGLERMPEPYGGASAWGKFLQKNLKYPGMAIDQGVSGRVWVSFIVEKDGHLSNIVVDRGAGYGMDEEALRVLKLAPAWKPGMQNGQPVRVKYNIPINFLLGDQ